MKAILKTLPPELGLKNDETFTSEANDKIRQKLVPELFKAMQSRYRPTYEQLNGWLKVLYKHRRNHYNYRKKGKIDQDNRRLYANNQINEVRKLLINISPIIYL